jgi:hypothetical protein
MVNKFVTACFLLFVSSIVQAQSGDFSRRSDGTPDISGIWQALNNANWNLEGQAASQGPIETLGAIGAVPPEQSVVEAGTIPYQAAAAEQRAQNFSNRRTDDPEAKCFMPGIPRATYMPQPFQIFQTDSDIMMAYQFAGAVRTVFMSEHMEAPIDSWMGWSNGRWEGDTLVIEVSGLNPNWLDRAGNFYSNAAKITERYTPSGPFHLDYEVTIEDPDVYEEAWSISMTLYRRVEESTRLYEFKCAEFAEEIMYGHLSKENYFRNLGIDINGGNDE